MQAQFNSISGDAYTRFVSRRLFPLHERLKRHDTVAVLRELERTEWLPRAEIVELQSRRLRALIERATTRVPYYRDMFRELHLDPASIREAADLQRLPLLDKAAIRKAGDRLCAEDAGPLQSASTSGSTGDPLKFFVGRDRVTHDVAAKWRATRWWGVDIGDPELVIWASPIETTAQDPLRAIRDRLLRSHFINAKDLSFPALEQMIGQIEAMNPRMLFGYTAAFARVARYLLSRGRRLHAPALKVVFVTTERLDPQDRAMIGEAFGAPAANGYGGRDGGFIAHDCPHGGMHITAEDIVVEIVGRNGQPVGPREAGEVVVTHLASGDFPFIRYRTGDIAEVDDGVCACGRGLPLLRDIHGRSNDQLVGHGGRVAHYTALSHLLKDLPGLHTFRAVQESLDLIRLLVVTERPLDERAVARIRSGLAEQLGETTELLVEQVADIPLDPTGKHRHIVCRVPASVA